MDNPSTVAESYQHCAHITARHGRTYFLATRLLPKHRRRAVHALYGFARIVDDLVDDPRPVEQAFAAGETRATTLDDLEHALHDRTAPAPQHLPELSSVLPAFRDTTARFDIPLHYFSAFLESMRMDIPGTPTYRPEYRSMSELREYMYGSAVVIGLQLLPVLGTNVPITVAAPHAAALGEAFQLTNFMRDVGEDLDRGRVYLPLDELAAFGVDRGMLERARHGSPSPHIDRALAHLIATTRATYRAAEPGIAMLDNRVQPGIRTAFTLYSLILDEIERNDFRVLDRRATVPARDRWTVALPQLARLAPWLGGTGRPARF